MKTVSYFFLFLIIVLFLFARLFRINQIPPSLYWDEASIGYNAYALTTDGKDEWGSTWPLHFRAFGEFKLPVYIYSVFALVKLGGISDLAVRLPAVFYSLGSILIVFLIANKIFNKTIYSQ